MKRWNVAITGFGGVGRAVADLMLARRARYAERYGADIRLTGVRRSRTASVDPNGLAPGDWDAGVPAGDDFLDTAQAHVLIEAGPSDFRTGGPGYGYMKAALSAGLHVVAISKGALVHDGPGLRALAARHGARLKISGAAGAALPTIDLIQHNLAGCHILSIEGVLNATSNHLLTEMMDRDVNLADALTRAQDAGFAEFDPRLDVEGWDAASKLLILLNFGLGASLTMADLSVGGIQHVTPADIHGWRAAGLSPRLVAHVAWTDGTLRAGVELRTYPATDPFALVRGTTKAIRIVTDAMGEIVATSHAAEPGATAAAALKDLEHILAAG
ncbi:homoserine dehydrogenase [Hansschlegelia sp. KR7-227]|uniref:homoserine dehydrogenase n=1 Tax=Hansschlegelia sp. KR7-227 TaxID=3400914 RepID=UPI003C03C1B2